VARGGAAPYNLDVSSAGVPVKRPKIHSLRAYLSAACHSTHFSSVDVDPAQTALEGVVRCKR
jgi:hypothetical protein